MKSGTLYVLGVGPGDPELLTIKALRILKEVSCICVPKGREEGSSLALSIVQKALNLDGKEIIEAYFPMKKTKGQGHGSWVMGQGETDTLRITHNAKNPPIPLPKVFGTKGGEGGFKDCELDAKWQETVETILSRLNKGADMAFLTIGDPTVYSTFFYLYDSLLELNPQLNIEIIPGVSSINAAASRAKISLGIGDEKIAVVPANYQGDIKSIIEMFDTVILMKVHKVFDDIINTLDKMSLLDNAVYISKVDMEDEKIFKNIREVKEEDLNYFSMVIVKK